MLSEKVKMISPSGTSAARTAASNAALKGLSIIDLTAGEIITRPSEVLLDAAAAAINRGENRYTETVGLPSLRKSIASYLSKLYACDWKPNQIAVTPGAKHALYLSFLSLLNHDDEVIIFSPYWPTFPEQVRLVGGKPVIVATNFPTHVPSMTAVEASLTKRTRAIIVNSPHNPTGAVYPKEFIIQLVSLAKEKDIWLIFDDSYARLIYDSQNFVDVFSLEPGYKTCVISSFSKELAVTGWRIGYVAGPVELIEGVKKLQGHTTSNPNVVAQHAIVDYLAAGDKLFETKLIERLQQARDLGSAILQEIKGIQFMVPGGAIFFYVGLQKWLSQKQNSLGLADADEFVVWLLQTKGVAVVSGSSFGDPYGIRISFGVDQEKLCSGLLILKDAMNEGVISDG